MGRITYVPETPWGRVTKGDKGDEKAQIHAGGKISAVYSFSRTVGYPIPSSSYPVFLFEQFIWFKLRAVKEGRPYEIATSAKFLETFLESNFKDQNLLCELDLHELACSLDRHSNRVPFSGDV